MKRFTLLQASTAVFLASLLLAVPNYGRAQSAPLIATQPQDQSVVEGSTGTFSVTVSGQTPLTYFWHHDSITLADDSYHISGSASAQLIISNTVTADAGSYWVIVSNRHGRATSEIATLTVYVPPHITVPPASATALHGNIALFDTVVSGTPPFYYQWQHDGTNVLRDGRITDPNEYFLYIPDVRMSDIGRYRLFVSNSWGTATSAEADLRVVPLRGWGDSDDGQISIPITLTNAIAIAAGSDTSLALRSDGTVYAWGRPLSPPADLTDCVAIAAGSYHALALRSDGTVVGWGANGSGETNVPTGLTNVVAISGGYNHSLALQRDGTVVGWGANNAGQATPPAGLKGVLAIAAGFEFSLALLNDGTAVGWGANSFRQASPYGISSLVDLDAEWVHGLGLKSDGTVAAWGDNSFYQLNIPARLSGVVALAGGNAHSLALKRDGTVIAWGSSSMYPIAPPAGLENVVAIAGGEAHSLALVENPTTPSPPVVWWQPPNRAVATNQTAVFKPYLLGSLPMQFQWYLNGIPLPGETNNWLVLPQLQTNQSGAYQLCITNRYAGTATDPANLSVLFPLIFVQQPESRAQIEGSSVTFSAAISGSLPVSYQWYRDDIALADDGRISGSLSNVLSISGIQTNDSGNYRLVASNAVSAVTSATATLDVLGAPRISVQPASHYGLIGRDTSFTVRATGVAPLSYQWYFNDSPLTDQDRFAGALSPELRIHDVQPGVDGVYRVVVSNSFGSATSEVATLSLSMVRYVNVNNSTPSPPYTNWATAATVIQDAIDASGAGDEVLVTNGVYESGSVSAGYSYYAGHRIALTKPLTVISVNGPSVTTIPARSYPYPASGRRCAYLTNGSMLAGFTLTAGETDLGSTSSDNQIGAGVKCQSVNCIVSNCIISGNVAGYYGGGAYSGTLINCTLANNTARDSGGNRTWGNGGGAAYSILRNCIIVNNTARYGGGGLFNCGTTNCLIKGNTAVWGGGTYVSTLVNCTVIGNTAYDDGGVGGAGGGGTASGSSLNSIIVQNTAPYGTPNYYSGSRSYCCTSPHPGGEGNIALDPMFMDYAGGNYRLQTNSPCVDAGTNSAVRWAVDLDGRPRIVDGLVDMGAYELQHLPWVIAGPTNQSVVLSSNAVFTVFTVGDEPFACQWQKDGVNLSNDGRFTGVSTRTLAIKGVDTPDAGGYRVVVSNALGSAISKVATLTILYPPTITVAPTDQSVALGAVAGFSVVAAGTEPLNYQWRKDGTNLVNTGTISGVSTPALQVVSVSTNDPGHYDVAVSNPYGTAISSNATLSLLPLGITNQPASRTIPAGTNVSFTVGVTGFMPIGYQWRFQQAELPSRTNALLTLTNVQSWNAGDYEVVVTNAYTALTSAVATLTVVPTAPMIVTHPVSRVVSFGNNASFTLTAKGSEPMVCRWQKNGDDLPGANGFALALSNVNSSFSGTYRASVSNSTGVTFTTNVTLTVSPVLQWGATNLQRASAIVPGSATNVVGIEAGKCSGPLPCFALRPDGLLSSWGWAVGTIPPGAAAEIVAISSGGLGPVKEDNNLALRSDGRIVHWYGGTVRSLPPSVTNGNIVAVAAGGTHQMVLRDDGAVVAWGSNAFGQTNVPPAATNIIAIAAGENHSLALRADGVVISWGRNDYGQTTAVSNLSGVVAISAAGNQSLALLANGSATGSTVTNQQGTAYGRPPAHATNLLAVSAGYGHSLALRADRTVVAWGRTNYGVLDVPAFATNVVAVAAGGALSLALVSDSSAAPIPPNIARPPLGRTLVAGQSPVLNALAVGGAPFRYQWYRDGAPVAGQTNTWLTLPNVLPGEAGGYQLVAMNDHGAATSTVAAVTVSIPEPQLRFLSLLANGFTFTYESIAGVLYVVEYCESLTAGPWTELNRRFGSGGTEVVTDPNASSAARFYRVRAVYAPPPAMSGTVRNGNTASFEFTTVEGAIYVVEYKSNLADPAWLELSRHAGTGTSIDITDPGAHEPSRFYRVRVE